MGKRGPAPRPRLSTKQRKAHNRRQRKYWAKAKVVVQGKIEEAMRRAGGWSRSIKRR